MAPGDTAVAYAGAPPGRLPKVDVFSWVFSNPFEQQSDFVPAARRVPHVDDGRDIFVDDKTNRALKLGQIKKDALVVAAGLRALGLDPSETVTLPPTPTCPRPELAPVVLIQLPNCLQIAPILLGVFASGLTATLVSPALTADEIAWILQNARPRVIITATSTSKAMHEALQKQEDASYFAKIPFFTVDVAKDVYPANAKPSPASSKTGETDWKSLLSSSTPLTETFTLSPESACNRTAVILWSSGTSGRSKGVLLSHHALNFSTASLWHDSDFFDPASPTQRWLGYAPFYHVFGLCNILLLAMCAGSTVYVMQTFKLDAVLASIERNKVTYLHMAPPVAVMLAKAAIVEPYVRRGAFRSVVAGVTGGAPLGHDIVVQVHRRLGFRVRLGYGLSETCSTTLQHGLSEADMHAHAGDSGAPHWGVELLIATEDPAPGADGTTRAAAPGKQGEILIRAPCLMTAYLPFGGLSPGATPDMSVSNDALTADGWFRTGDVGFLSPDGRLTITDRLKELIKVRAYQVAPAELEAVLCSSESVADAGVIGVYDESEATEWPRAFVVARNETATPAELGRLAHELRQLVEGRTARYKWLMGGIVFVEQIPKSPSGKILRRVLKQGPVKGHEVKVYQKKKRNAKL